MSDRIYLNQKSKTEFIKNMEKLGAHYIQGDGGEAVFVGTGNWIYKQDTQDSYKVALRLTIDGELDIGCIRKSCDNYEDRAANWYSKSDTKWLIATLNKILPHMK